MREPRSFERGDVVTRSFEPLLNMQLDDDLMGLDSSSVRVIACSRSPMPIEAYYGILSRVI